MSGTGSGIWNMDSVKNVAESCGIANLPDQVASSLAADVEYRLREIIEESMKFMRHSHRNKLKVEDVDHALKVKNIEPLWGFSAPEPPQYRKATSTFGNVYFVEEEEIDLTRLLHAPLPPLPREISYTAHWLAVEGVQPNITQNPTAAELSAVSSDKAALSKSTKQTSSNEIDVRPLVKHVLSRELQLYFDRLTSAATDTDESMREASLASLRADTGLGGLVPYLVQWLAEKVTTGLKDTNNLEMMLNALHAMLQNTALSVEPYLHQMIPIVLSALLSGTIGEASSVPPASEIRTHAASLLHYILAEYAGSYPTLRPRLMRTLLRSVVQEGKPAGSRLGAVTALAQLGREAVLGTLGKASNLRALGTSLANQGETEEVSEIVERVGAALSSALNVASTDASMSPHTEANEASQAEYSSMLAQYLAQRPELLQALRDQAQEPEDQLSADAMDL